MTYHFLCVSGLWLARSLLVAILVAVRWLLRALAFREAVGLLLLLLLLSRLLLLLLLPLLLVSMPDFALLALLPAEGLVPVLLLRLPFALVRLLLALALH